MKGIVKRSASAVLCLLLAAAAAIMLCSCDQLYDFFNYDLSIDENEPEPVPELVSHYIDVGQGDSTFIELPDGSTMLIDAGVTDMGDSVANYIRNLGYDRIDYVIATHPHSDHIGGMRRVINSLDVGAIYMPRAETDTYTYEKLLKAIKDKGLKIRTAKAGVNIVNSTDPEFTVDIIAPVKQNYEDLNNASAVIKICYGDVSFLYTGDAEEISEKDILASGADVSAEIVKVGHHGSYKASCKEFVEAVGADYGIISCGKNNDYGHPHKKAVDRWEKTGTTLLRTDQCGTITVSTDGMSYYIETEKE